MLDTSKLEAKFVGFESEVKGFIRSLEYNFLISPDGWTNLFYQAEKFDNETVFNKLLMLLDKQGVIETNVEPNRRWGEIRLRRDFLIKRLGDNIDDIRYSFKMDRYVLNTDKVSNYEPQRKIDGSFIDADIKRDGFKKVSEFEFRYDIKYIKKYKSKLINELVKDIKESKYEVNGLKYQDLAKDVIEYYSSKPFNTYNMGKSNLDSRGRVLYDGLSKIGNPVSSKEFRALMKIQGEPLTFRGLVSLRLFVAELIGTKGVTIREKYQIGKEALENNLIPDCVDLESKIWLERIYERYNEYKLDPSVDWDVPIEIDATASMLGFYGALLGDKELLKSNNVIYNKDEVLKDAWEPISFKGRRKMFKTNATPQLYGASKSSVKFKDVRDMIEFNDIINNGYLSKANKLKDLLVSEVKTQPEMKVNIAGEKFKVFCNKFNIKGEKEVKYKLFDSKTQRVRFVNHMTITKTPDLNSFKRYFATLLIHNLDSRVANQVAYKVDCLPIHDAFILHPNKGFEARKEYSGGIETLYSNRHKILNKYLVSIGINPKKLDGLIGDIKDFKCSLYTLK